MPQASRLFKMKYEVKPGSWIGLPFRLLSLLTWWLALEVALPRGAHPLVLAPSV